MNKAEFDHWLEILRRNFPEHPMLKEAYRSWYPSNASQPPEIALSPIQVRPTEVVTATGLLSLSLAIGVVKLILAWRLINSAGDDGIDFPFALSTLIFALNVLLIWKIWQGRNWARVTLLVVFTIGALDMVTALLSTPGFPRFRAFAHSANRATRNLCMCITIDFRAEEPAVVSAEGDTIVLSPVSNVTQLSSRNPRPLSAPGPAWWFLSNCCYIAITLIVTDHGTRL